MPPFRARNAPPRGGPESRNREKVGNLDFHINFEIHMILTFPTFPWDPRKLVFTGNQLPGPEMHGTHNRCKGNWVPPRGPEKCNIRIFIGFPGKGK